MTSVKTITLEMPGKLVLSDTEPPGQVGDDQALVRVRSIGICGTDLHAFRGRQPFFSYPRVLGHELGVEVVAVGRDVKGITPGDQCAVEPYLSAACASPVAAASRIAA
jgi:threonine dehydrogenase-like Zn-dependent dehydrogenase